jgi:hypothetical protein
MPVVNDRGYCHGGKSHGGNSEKKELAFARDPRLSVSRSRPRGLGGFHMLTFTHSIGPDVRIQFSDKPDARIRAMLKANGFRWAPAAGLWWRRRVSGAADFIAALEKVLSPRRPARFSGE